MKFLRQKGQITLDAILAIIAFVMFLTAFGVLMQGAARGQIHSGLGNQSSNMAAATLEIASTSAIFSDAYSARVRYATPVPHAVGDVSIAACEVTIAPENVFVKQSLADGTAVDKTIDYFLPDEITPPGTINCGEPLILEG